MRATFMAKPFAEFAGNGMHVHISLAARTARNAFARPDGLGERLCAMRRPACSPP